ncbi:transposase [uncultured Microbulbifer sp.]|uniref:transposase n=1 Tax=uncultured Microbulbifer sp. TaxID=348147 RepID=UPI00344CC9C5
MPVATMPRRNKSLMTVLLRLQRSVIRVKKTRGSRKLRYHKDFRTIQTFCDIKNLNARWTKNNNETHYGYKNQLCLDSQHKLLRSYAVTSAAVHDSNVSMSCWLRIALRVLELTETATTKTVKLL